jgi:hypothetical protein
MSDKLESGFDVAKLLIYATRLDPKDEVEQHATGVQTQMLVRIAVSARV